MSRTALIAGNWKLHKDHQEAIHLVSDLGLRLKQLELGAVEVAVHPPFTDLRTVQSIVEGDKLPISLGAQHVSHHEKGAFTGEVSVAMLAKLQTRYVLVGHSERRQAHHEADELVAAKALQVLDSGMTPVICVGETADERNSGRAVEVVRGQVAKQLSVLQDRLAD